MKKFFVVFLVLSTLISVASAVSAADEPNLCIGAASEAISRWSDSETYDASMMIDGDMDTRWNAGQADPAESWIIIDLGAAKVFNRTVVYEFSNRTTDYVISVSSDKTNWTEINKGTTLNPLEAPTNDDKNAFEINFDAVEARYIKVDFLSTNVVSIWELELYNIGNVSLTPAATEAEPEQTEAPKPEEAQPAAQTEAPKTGDNTIAFLMISMLMSAAMIGIYKKRAAKNK